MTHLEKNNAIKINVYIIRGALRDLSAVDFSCVNLTFINLASKKLKTISDSYTTPDDLHYSLYNVVKDHTKKMPDEPKCLHVLLPIDFQKPVNQGDYLRCIDVLKLLFPSDLQYETIAEFNLQEDNVIEWKSSSSYHFYTTGESFISNYLTYPINKQVAKVNAFFSTLY